MVQVTVAEAKTQLSSLLDAVEAGVAVVITHTPRQAHRRAGAAYPWA
jgi:antitoxin (DNA-binding transcriptional repressor) of toxin-antitoxin stability system